MKHVLILGAARSGKSTLAQMLADKFGYSIISVDAFISAMEENYPDKGFAHHLKNNHKIAPFVVSYANAIMYNLPKEKFVVEGYHISLSDAVKLFEPKFEIVVLGYPKLTAQEAFANVRKYEGKFDYTKAISDEKLLNIISRHVEYSKEFEQKCKELGLSFYDTSYNREEVLRNIIAKICPNNKKHLTESIVGERIKLLRPKYNIKTAQAIFSVIDKCRNEFLPWLGWVKHTNSADDSLKFLETVDNDWKDNNQFVYEIVLNDRLIGLISIINIAWQHKRAEIGYWLDTEHTKKGYMSEAVNLIEKELFNQGFNKIVIHTDVLNTKSANIPIRLGYKLEGILQQEIYSEPNNRFRDRNVFAKLKNNPE